MKLIKTAVRVLIDLPLVVANVVYFIPLDTLNYWTTYDEATLWQSARSAFDDFLYVEWGRPYPEKDRFTQ